MSFPFSSEAALRGDPDVGVFPCKPSPAQFVPAAGPALSSGRAFNVLGIDSCGVPMVGLSSKQSLSFNADISIQWHQRSSCQYYLRGARAPQV